MIRPKNPAVFAQLALCFAAVLSASAAEIKSPAETHFFTGAQSCASSSCHGGGTGRNEFLVYQKKDRHVFAAGILGKGTSLKIAEALGLGEPTKAAQCTVCHSPMEAVAATRLAPEMKQMPDRGVSCEACHGAAGEWLRFHTRKDATYQQILATGLRDLIDVGGRANACVACHLNLDEKIRQAGHPELFFELDGQAALEPPHYVDVRPSIGPRSWITGQATALREMSWKLSTARDERLAVRWKALVWLLQMTESGAKELPSGEDFSAMQAAADLLARKVSREVWTKTQITGQLRKYASSHKEFSDAKADRTALRRRAEVLVPAMDRLWAALKKEGGVVTPGFEKSLNAVSMLSHEGDDFAPAEFAKALGELEAQIDSALKP
ncbi:MAG: multiheme c-type cytochrome [Verrucomicrobia bacterium]|nr:multiheme c-type cytochrome [Verrucomicrobiota bacterium]